MSNAEVRVRKSIAALEGKDERTGYFICLKMLGILPTPPGSGFEKFTYNPPPTRNGVKEVYVPKCLHDVLIASHATSCEHRNFYFSYYHRHLTILTEIFLNLAHQILKGGITELKRIYPSPEYDWLHGVSTQSLWGAVFNQYQKLQLPKQMSDHYWNPTDYKNPAELAIPVELTPQSKNYEIDALFHKINVAFPYQHNIQRRWYQDKRAEYSDFSNRFNPYPTTYTADQTNFINGNLDPRKNEELYLVDDHYIDSQGNPQTRKKFLYDFGNRNRAIVQNRNYNHYNKTNNFLLNSITTPEALANYGAKIKNLQYITRTEQDTYKLSDQLLESYNNALPHYQYARALFGQNMKKYMEDSYGGERSHNYMHNNLRDILNDGTYSVTSLLFWPYHSWIDAQVQIKVRRSNAAGRADYDYMVTALNEEFTKAFPTTPENFGLSGIFDQFEFGSMANWQISGTGPIDSKSAGYYPITEWVSPGVKNTTNPLTRFDISPGCCARDLALTKTNIRDSFNFNELYRDHYIVAYADRYKLFNFLKEFNFNFDYQVGSSPADLDKRLGKNAQNLPAYLAEMESAYLAQNQVILSALKGATDQSFKKNQTLRTVDPDFDEAESVCIRKLFATGIELFASYSPFVQNGPNSVYLKLKNILHEVHGKCNEKEIRAVERYIQYGIDVHDIFIFGKANFADTCYKCVEDKATFEDLDENLRLRNGRIWQHLHLSSLNEVYFDSKHPEVELRSIHNKISLVPNGNFKIYRLISGAEELVVSVSSSLKVKDIKAPKYVRIDAHSYSVRENAVKSVLSKKELTFHSKFDFYKIFDVDLNNKRNYFDRYVYKTLKGWVAVGDKRAKFEFEIPNFQRLLRLNLQVNVEGENEKQRVLLRVTDADFEAKQVYYRQAVKCQSF